MKLSNFVKLAGSNVSYGTLSITNVDDFFRQAFIYGIKEMEVNNFEMHLIVHFYLANVGNDKNGNQGKIMREGVLDKFLGIDLILSK